MSDFDEFGSANQVGLDAIRRETTTAYYTFTTVAPKYFLHREPFMSFDAWKATLITRPDVLGGEAAFPNSRLAVRHVGEMARRGASLDEIVADYPNLSKQDVEFAMRFVAENAHN